MDAKNYTFSIIIPYYNVKIDQFETCIKSLLLQDLSLLKEIIVVNDGSDEEYENQLINLVKKLNKEERIIKLIHQKNLGVVIGRKTGFKNSNGDIILFVDPDDSISDEKYLFKLNNYFKKYKDIDIIKYDYKSSLDINKKINSKKPKIQQFKLDINWFLNKNTNGYLPIAVWHYAYKREIY